MLINRKLWITRRLSTVLSESCVPTVARAQEPVSHRVCPVCPPESKNAVLLPVRLVGRSNAGYSLYTGRTLFAYQSSSYWHIISLSCV